MALTPLGRQASRNLPGWAAGTAVTERAMQLTGVYSPSMVSKIPARSGWRKQVIEIDSAIELPPHSLNSLARRRQCR
jgi:hypothetical protein